MLLLWRLAGDFPAADLRTSAPVLDSFAEPALCLAGLRQEAARLMLAYTEGSDALEASQLTSPPDSTSRAGPFRGQALADLHAAVQDLQVDLDRALLVAYYRHGSWSEFVDCYLRLVQQTPKRTVGEAMTWSALVCAQRCGRFEEVTNALHHLSRFHPGLRSAQASTAALNRWEKEHLPSPGRNQQ
jgi:hypothetical protein